MSRVSFPSGQLVLNKSLNSLPQPTCLWFHQQVSFQSTWSLHYSKLKQLLEAASPILPIPLKIWTPSPGLYWKVKRCSPKVWLNFSTISLSLWTFTFPLLILKSYFAISLVTSHEYEFMLRINLKNFWPCQWSSPLDCVKSSWDLRRIFWGERFNSLESACNINNCQCILIDFLWPCSRYFFRKEIWIAHQMLVLKYALGQVNKSARWLSSSAKAALHHPQTPGSLANANYLL